MQLLNRTPLTVIQLYRNIQEKLQQADIPDSGIEAGILLCHYLQISRSDIFITPDLPVPKSIHASIEQALTKRLQRIPLSYVIGEQHFWSRSFMVSSDVLIPRSETEILVEKVIEVGRSLPTCNILDLGTGSGVIAITLALECDASVVSVDLSCAALCVARKNVIRHKASKKVSLLNSDWHSSLLAQKTFDIVVSNPPYVARSIMQTLQPELAYEPSMALFGGDSGLDEIARIFDGLEHFIKPGGWIFMEIGFDQGTSVVELLNSFGKYDQVMVHKDYAGLPRILQARIVG